MRSTITTISGMVLVLTFGAGAMAAPASTGTRAATPPATHSSAPAQPDCQKVGGDVSALIDQRKDSANIAQARSVFQIGIMECMEGADDQANRHYMEAKNLLAGPESPSASIRVPSP